MPEKTKTNKPDNKSAFNAWALIAAILITVIFVGIILIWQNNAMKQLKNEVAGTQKTLSQKVEKIENGTSKETVVTEAEADPTEDWETFSIAGYEFIYPDSWTYTEQESQVPGQTIYGFYDENDVRVGLLFTPVLETGFEAMVYEETNRLYKKKDDVYTIKLLEGRPDLTEYPEYYEQLPEKEMIIIMQEKKPPQEFYQGDFPESLSDDGSVLLIIRNLDETTMVEIADLIYESIE